MEDLEGGKRDLDVSSEIAWQVSIPVIVAAVILLLVGIGMLVVAQVYRKHEL